MRSEDRRSNRREPDLDEVREAMREHDERVEQDAARDAPPEEGQREKPGEDDAAP
jgi:hypothetical protein